ncbi:MAG TPA: 4'-phosphopantetheinyl transferase, partial [Clostridia bacterium]|nr:4'-phosphopantetheinyl transferase [Clostridia bacterium]
MRSRRLNLEMSWPAGLEQPPLEPRDVHVWSAALDTPVEPSEDFSGVLDETEISRASRFHFERDRNCFINAHAFLRRILARYLHT